MTRRFRLFLASLLAFGWLLAIPAANAAEGLTAELYNVNGQNNAPYIPQGLSPTLTTNVSNIDFQWGGGSVLGGPSEDVIVRFIGSIRSDSTQNISFYAPADDGVRLYIDGTLIINDWYDKGGGGSTSSPISFTAGVPKTIELFYYENGGGAWVKLYWQTSGGNMTIVPASAFTSQIIEPVVKTIGAPRNLTVSDSGTALTLNWEAPNTGNTQPERYAINFNADGNGWGIATGNVGDSNALNTSIVIPYSTLESLKPSGTTWTFSVRSDNDTNSLYSSLSNQVTIKVGKTQAEKDAELEAQQELQRQSAANSAILIYETSTMTALSDYISLTTLKNTAQSLVDLVKDLIAKAGFQSRVDSKSSSINQIKAKLEADQAAAIAEAARIESERLAAIAAAKAEADRLAAEAAAKKAEEDRLAAEAAAKKAEEERIAAEIAKAKAEEEARLAEEARLKAEAEAKAAEEAKIKAEAEAKAKAEEDARLEKERIAAEEAKAKAEAEAKAKAEADAKKLAEQKAAEEAKLKAEADKIAAELAAKKAEEEKLAKIAEQAKAGKELSEEQVAAVVTALVSDLKPGEAISAATIIASGVSYSDLPPETPVELRTDSNGNEVIITAEVAAQVELVSDPAAFAAELFNDPGAALAALGSIGADMSPQEREESTKAVVATVIAAGAAINAVGAATAGGTSSGGSTGGGNSGGSGNGSTGSRRNEKW